MNLSDYKRYEDTKSCYLDGRYFNLVFANYEGLIRKPLEIHINYTVSKDGFYYYIDGELVKTDKPALVRVIIKTPNSRHSNLLIINFDKKIIYRFEPCKNDYNEIINNAIIDFFKSSDFFKGYQINQIVNDNLVEKNENCDQSGFCVAYVIKYAYDYIHNNKKFDPSNIMKFAKKIESSYILPPGNVDEEYGMFDNPWGPTLVGGFGGAAIGALAAGPGGALVGGALGGLGGYAISQTRR
jgi:hypothetical protein